MSNTLLAAVLDRKGYIVGDSNASSGFHWLEDPDHLNGAPDWRHAGWKNVRCFGVDTLRGPDRFLVYLAAGNGVLAAERYDEWRVTTDWRVTEVLDVAFPEADHLNGTIFGATAYGPIVSTDLGRTWKTVVEGLPEYGTSATYVSSICWLPVSQSLVIGTEFGLFRAPLTANGVGRWERVGPRRVPIRNIAVDAVNEMRLAAASDGDGLMRSDDGGRTWSNQLSGEVLYATAWSPIESGFIACGGIESRLWYSSDAGANWRSLSAPNSDIGLHAMAFDPKSSQVLWVGTTDAGIFRVDLVTGKWTFAGLPDASIRKLAFVASTDFNLFAREHNGI